MNTTLTKPEISIEDFMAIEAKLSIRIGQVVAAERVPKSNGLKLTVIFGQDKSEEKTAFTNLGKTFEPEAFIGLLFPFVMNLAPATIKGVLSEVMIMVGSDSEGKVDLENNTIGSKLM